ncbi:MAG: tetratricopeptide repeat-containing sulfotransferase family protein, partial [Woeseiales bacterium]
ILVRSPENVEALRLLAATATSQNQHPDAETLLKRALELTPDFGRALADLVVSQMEQEKTEEAIESAKRLLRIGADNPDSHLLYGNALSAAGVYDEAITTYQKTLEMSKDHPGALSGLGHNLRTVGRHEESIAAYRQCIKAFPYFTESYWSLANLKTFKFTDDEVTSMEGLLQHENIPDDSKVHLSNALGLEYENRKDYDKAFEYFRQCNEIKRTQEYYDPVATEDLHDRLIDVFSAAFLSQQPAESNHSATPIFIIGLPRSGSTLLEQILASHSQVEGTHELSDLGRVVHQIPSMLKKRGRYPNSIADIDKGGLAQLGHAYLSRTEKFRSGLEYFSDKNPNNFGHVGLASLILPNAIFINAQRHPLDSCFGSYKQLFAKGNPFSYHLTDLAEFYLQYVRLIDHWHAVMPGKILDVRYEDVVGDLETQVRRILDHCGLPFEEQCLRFHETDRAVQTASSEQVRRPIYSSSVNLWRNYEQQLQPTIDILAPILRDLPEADRPDSL